MERSQRFDDDQWQQQVDEVLALSSILGDDLRLLSNTPHTDSEDAEEADADPVLDVATLLDAASPWGIPLTFEVSVHVDVPAAGLAVRLCSRQPSADGSGASSSTDTTCVPDIRVVHLPPVKLRITLPFHYPSQAAPVAELSAAWLQSHQVTQLHDALQAQWHEPGATGQSICFQWIEWLRTQCLLALGIAQVGTLLLVHSSAHSSRATSPPAVPASFSSSVPASSSSLHAAAPVLAPPGAGPTPSPLRNSSSTGHHTSPVHQQTRAMAPAPDREISPASPKLPSTSSPSPPLPDYEPSTDKMLDKFVQYSKHREAELFQHKAARCPVCYENVIGAKCVRLEGCGHYSCRDCFKAYVHTQMQEGAVDSIRCMEFSCRAQVHPAVLRQVMSHDEYARWEQLLLQRTLDKMEDVSYCPRCQHVCVADEERCARCPKCLFVFCAQCSDGWHPGSACVQAHDALERRREQLQRNGHVPAEERQRQLQDLLNQHKSYLAIMHSSKQCPKCHMAIQKSEGCNKMRCTQCDTTFCFLCGKAVQDYNHFWNGSCALFQEGVQTDVNEMNALQNDRYLEVAAATYMVREARRGNMIGQLRFQHCPTCKQASIKTSNLNLMRCHACTTNFCFMCRAVLHTKPGQHFGSSRCRLHTD